MGNKNIFKALAEFQQECPVIHKSTSGYNYTYADLPTIFKVINPLLKKNGLGFTQLVNNESIKTILFHIESGETIESDTNLLASVSLNKMNAFQVFGSQITYMRRYSLSSLLGIITDKDMNAHGTQNAIKKQLPELKKDTPAFGKAKEYYKSNNSFVGIEKVYSISAELKKELKNG